MSIVQNSADASRDEPAGPRIRIHVGEAPGVRAIGSSARTWRVSGEPAQTQVGGMRAVAITVDDGTLRRRIVSLTSAAGRPYRFDLEAPLPLWNAAAPTMEHTLTSARFPAPAATLVQASGAATPARPLCDISGRWQMDTTNVGSSQWTFTRRPDGSYDGQESGLGSAVGTAQVTGSDVYLTWQAGSWAGTIVLRLDPGCGTARGQHLFQRGRTGAENTAWRRLDGPVSAPASPAAAAPRPAAPGLARSSAAADVTYEIPVRNGVAVDGCASWQAGCGQPAADQFCRQEGFAGARSFSWAYDLRTWNIGSNRYCDRAADNTRCGGLRSVVCTGSGAPPAASPADAPPPAARGPADGGSAPQRIAALRTRVSPDNHARFYADATLLLARYGSTVGWINGLDASAPQNDPGRGVSDWNAHHRHATNNPASVEGLLAQRLATLRGSLPASAFAQLESELGALLARYGG